MGGGCDHEGKRREARGGRTEGGVCDGEGWWITGFGCGGRDARRRGVGG